MSEQRNIADPKGAAELLRLVDVSKTFRRGSAMVRVLEAASLRLGSGEVVCVLASRGQGKSTLLSIAAGMQRPDSGRVLFEGEDLAELPDRDLSLLLGGRIAWAGREGPGMAMSMLDYVAMPLLVSRRGGGLRRLLGRGRRQHEAGRDVYARAHAALERVGALACAERHWDEISDWERALAELAQAIAAEPGLLLIDDLTDGLGIRETDELTALIRELSREMGMGVLMGVSDGQATLRCDRIVALQAGRLLESPATEQADVIELPHRPAARAGGR